MELPSELAALPAFPSVEAFYADDERRRRSPEWDYGVHWRIADEPWPRWRVSWVVATGDLYAHRAMPPLVLLLGNVPADGEYPVGAGAGLSAWSAFHRRQTIERVLAGWAEVTPPTLAWALDRLANFVGEAA